MLQLCGRSLLLLAPASFRYTTLFCCYFCWYGTGCHSAVLAVLIVSGIMMSMHQSRGERGQVQHHGFEWSSHSPCVDSKNPTTEDNQLFRGDLQWT